MLSSGQNQKRLDTDINSHGCDGPSCCQIVISDIDGTITKSDVRGMILPMIGRQLCFVC